MHILFKVRRSNLFENKLSLFYEDFEGRILLPMLIEILLNKISIILKFGNSTIVISFVKKPLNATVITRNFLPPKTDIDSFEMDFNFKFKFKK